MRNWERVVYFGNEKWRFPIGGAFRSLSRSIFALGVFVLVASTLVASLSSTAAFAAYPNKPIKCIVMWRPGGGLDTYTRIFTKYLEKALGQPVIVENITGGAGAIGYSAAKSARPDGYTLVTISSDMLRYKMMGTADIGVDDFDIIAGYTFYSPILVVPGTSKIKTLADFIAAAKAKPNTLLVGVSDIGGFHHIPLLELEEAGGFDVKAVAHSGTPEITAGILGRHLDAAVTTLRPTESYIKDGKIRVLAHFGDQPLKEFPKIKSAKELGYDAVWAAYGGIGGPKGLPQDVKDALLTATKKVWNDPNFVADIAKIGSEVSKITDYRGKLLDLKERQLRMLKKLGLAK